MGKLESEVTFPTKNKPTLSALKAKYERYLQDVLEKELYVPDERHDPILPRRETDIKKSFQAYKSMVDVWTNVGHELVSLYESQGAMEEARLINNRIGFIKDNVIRARERFEDILWTITLAWKSWAFL